MSKNRSPWIHQLDHERPIEKLKQDLETDVAIVGGGIAGVSTAFFLLKNTDKKVVLVEGGRLGQGATGHNAGQITSYLAKPLHELVKEFKPQMVIEAQKAIEEEAWELLDVIYTEAQLDIPLSRFTGHLGVSSKEHLISFLEDNKTREESGLPLKEILVSDSVDFLPEIEKDFPGLYTTAPLKELLARLETDSSQFVAVLSEQKGCMNSALFTQEVAKYLLNTYTGRFKVFEHTHITKVVLHKQQALLDALEHTLTCKRVILCTNGFDSITIFDEAGLEIDTKFHHSVESYIGYMSGYLDKPVKQPTAISYFPNAEAELDAPYMYLTRRPYEYNDNKHNLISIGGPELFLESRKTYEREHEYPDWAKDEIDAFVHDIYKKDPKEKVDYIFTWHGLMGYTPSRLRSVGVEPKNSVLLYNLGCNGVGILPSIYGGKRISQIIKGEKLEPSIFDPK